MKKSKIREMIDNWRKYSQLGCCMSCTYWRYTHSGEGECMYFNKSIFTDEGFYCKAFIESLKP